MNDIIIRKQDLMVPNWLSSRDRALESAASITEVNDAATFDKAGQCLNAFSHLTKELEAERKKLTSPLDKAKKEIMAQEKDLVAQMADEQLRLRKMANDYASRMAQQRAEAERAALAASADRASLEAEAAEAFGGASLATPIDPFVPDALKSSSVRQVNVYTFEITDASKIDRKFLSIDESKIRAFCNYLRQMDIDPKTVDEPGLIFKKEIRIDSK